MDITEKMYRAFSGLPATDTLSFGSKANPEYTREHLALSITPANLLLALHRAREAHELAVSYRNFKVGAAIVALRVGGASNFQILTGINVKPDENSSLNGHAEQMAFFKAKDRTFNAVSIVAVVGKTQTDQQSGNEMYTLHPCGKCRAFMSQHPLVDPEITLIATALPTLRTIELSSLNELHTYHDTDTHLDDEIPRFELPDLSLLRPFTPKAGQILSLDDSPEAYEDERIWDNTIGAFLTEWRLKHLRS